MVTGPPWLTKDRQAWPMEPAIEPSEIAELKKQTVTYDSVPQDTNLLRDSRLFIDSRGSQRITCNSKSMRSRRKSDKSSSLSVEQLNKVILLLTRAAQLNEFTVEIKTSNPNREYRVKASFSR